MSVPGTGVQNRQHSGFKADFNPFFGTSDSPANYASENSKMVEFDLLYRLKMSEIRPHFF